MVEKNGDYCEYFIKSADNPAVGYFGQHIICDKFDCVSNEGNNNGKFFSAELGVETGFCIKTNLVLDNLDDARLEKIADDKNIVQMNKDFAEIKPFDSRTEKPYENSVL